MPAAGSASAIGLRRWTLQAREQPTTHAEVVEYLLSTEGDEMQFEVARTRPLLTPELFDYLREQTSAPLPLHCSGGIVADAGFHLFRWLPDDAHQQHKGRDM